MVPRTARRVCVPRSKPQDCQPQLTRLPASQVLKLGVTLVLHRKASILRESLVAPKLLVGTGQATTTSCEIGL
jgi:hypothetical protein